MLLSASWSPLAQNPKKYSCRWAFTSCLSRKSGEEPHESIQHYLRDATLRYFEAKDFAAGEVIVKDEKILACGETSQGLGSADTLTPKG